MIAFCEGVDPLGGVPRHLVDKKAVELVNSWATTYNIRCLGGDPSGILHVDISQASKADVFTWMDSVGCVAVDLQPQDLPTFAGRSVATLAASDLLNADPAVRQGCSRLEPSEILSTIDELIRLALQAGASMRDASDQYIDGFGSDDFRHVVQAERDEADNAAIQRLRNAGFDVPDEIDLGKPHSSFPDEVQPDPDQSEFGSNFGRRVIDPWQEFNN